MSWYDLFSRFYDASLEELYAPARLKAADALDLGTAQTVLDLPVGTGQSLDAIVERLSTNGRVLGVDLSSGMLAKAENRATTRGYSDRVRLRRADVHSVDQALLQDTLGTGMIDRLHIFLGLTAFADYEEAFTSLWELLAPGGRAVVVDVHAERLGFQGRMVNLMARADITRRVWEPLESRALDYSREALEPNKKYGGTLWVASGVKPDSSR